ncbi:hypothetical protein D3C71_1522620 [compost metagenome]
MRAARFGRPSVHNAFDAILPRTRRIGDDLRLSARVHMNHMVGVSVAPADLMDGDGAWRDFGAEYARVGGGGQRVMETAGMLQVAQQVHGVVQGEAVQHRARQEHARHARMPLPRAQVVDGLDHPRAIGAEGMAGQGSGVVEAQVAGRAFQCDVHQIAASIQIGIAIFVVADPARPVGAFQGDRGAAVRGAVQQIAAAMP